MSAVYTSIKSVNLALRFLLELCALAALAYWGSHTGTGLIAKIGLGIGTPLVAAVIWGIFVASKASVTVPEPWHLILELLVFGSAVAGLVAAGRPTLGWASGRRRTRLTSSRGRC